jgi:hypothetical protein
LILGFSLPAHAQSKGTGMVAGGSSGGVTSNGTGGGGGGFGGSSGGGLTSSNFSTLPSIPPAVLRSTAISGTNADFVPSTFLSYDQAIAEGQAVLDAQHKSVAEAAMENNRARRSKAKAAIIENAVGDPVIVPR